MEISKYTSLTIEQKLLALSMRFYDGYIWEPKVGDYYTSSRNDLELYQIVSEDEEKFYTVYCDKDKQGDQPPAEWKKEKFLKDFGEKRVFVYVGILERSNDL